MKKWKKLISFVDFKLIINLKRDWSTLNWALQNYLTFTYWFRLLKSIKNTIDKLNSKICINFWFKWTAYFHKLIADLQKALSNDALTSFKIKLTLGLQAVLSLVRVVSFLTIAVFSLRELLKDICTWVLAQEIRILIGDDTTLKYFFNKITDIFIIFWI